ncbi:glycoside hydrolase family 97 catalytic domain-containing protein [Hydrocarboniphaga sp.]|uniref:glycoside hydrolase family 97 catalytic domain-containing protein n=1 Tax=Hydrocarboniphaga sp. TaxID=2033016 RepID=UPI003D09DB34
MTRLDAFPVRACALAFALLCSSAPGTAADVPAPQPIRALLLTGGCCHDYVSQRDVLERGLEARANVEITHLYADDSSSSPALPFFTRPDYARGYDVVIHAECAAGIDSPLILDAVLQPHREGVPGVNLHCAMHSYRSGDWEKPVAADAPNARWFAYLGLQSSGHGAQAPIALALATPLHAIARGLVPWTTPAEELYNNLALFDVQPVLLGTQKPTDTPLVVAWTHEYGPRHTRVFGTTLAHNAPTMADPRYLDLVARGLLWATGHLSADGQPSEGYGPRPAARSAAHAGELQLRSPDGAVAFNFSDAGGQPRYAVSFKGKAVLAPSPIGLDLDKGGEMSTRLRVEGSARSSVDRTYQLIVGKTSTVRERYNELSIDLREAGENPRRLQLIARAYDDGVAFRYRLPQQPGLDAVMIRGELTRFDFPADYGCWGLNLGRFGTSHEGEFDPVRASRMREFNLFDAPLVCTTGSASFAITEADLRDYAGMYLTGRGDGGLGAAIKLSPRLDDPTVAVKTRIGSDVWSPWRVLMLADNAGKLIESNLITSLNPPTQIQDTSWIKPGKSAWDWWNGPVVSGVDKPGMNNETIRRFIDFAAEAKLQYMLIDEGWYAGAGGAGVVKPGVDVTRTVAEIDMPALVAYAAERQVGLWVWLNWKALNAQMDEALERYQSWGIKGIKVDFMDRDDQEMVDFYHRLLKKTAEHHLMVDLHGAYHPTGLIRSYPHYLTQEGVLGAENNKWSRRITATHNVMLAYTRMLLGPMDYMPGGFRHVRPEDFNSQFTLPRVMTTRGQALAMYVVYDSPFACVSDSPDAYKGQPGFDFISAVPTNWDETRVLAGDIGEYIVIARRKGPDWYVGAMNNEHGRSVKIPLDFLGEGSFAATVYEDGKAVDQLKIVRNTVDRHHSIRLTMAGSGGGAIRLQAAPGSP